MRIEFRHGLIFTEVQLCFKGKNKVVKNIVIDTGASKSLISLEAVEDLGIKVENNDEIVVSYGIGGKEHAFVKKIDKVMIGNYGLDNFGIDFCSQIYDDINGLLGLDILRDGGFIIDLKELTLCRAE